MGEKAFIMGHGGDWDATSRSGWPEPEDRSHQFGYDRPQIGTASCNDTRHATDSLSGSVSSLYVLSPESLRGIGV